MPPLAPREGEHRRTRNDETPTLVERPPVELSRRDDDDELGLDRPLFGGNTDVVDLDEYDQLVSSSAEDDEPELDFDQAPTPLSPLPVFPRPPALVWPDGSLSPGRDASVELVFEAPARSRPEPPPVPPPRMRVATPYAVGKATDRGLPAIDAPRRPGRPRVWVLLLAAGGVLLLGLTTLAVFLIARS